MKYHQIQEIALVYGEKELIEEFLEKFQMDRGHDGAPLKAILLKGDRKKELRKFIWKGD